MRDTGLLILGAGETVMGQTDLFQLASVGRGMYRKSAAPDPVFRA